MSSYKLVRSNLRLLLAALIIFHLACGQPPEPAPILAAFVGGRIIDGTGGTPIEDGVLIVRDGRIEAVGASGEVDIPEGAEVTDATGKTIIPGLINTHGHVGTTKGLESGPEYYTKENILDQLELHAHYGVTTVISLGDDDEEGVRVRDSQQSAADLQGARLYLAGPVVNATSPEEARRQVKDLAALGVDFVKIRVDDFLGTREKMPPEVYQAVIDQAHQEGLRVAAHLFYLEDGKSLLRSGVDFLAHSIRDREVDDEFIWLVKDREVCLCPTLVREVSTFVYEKRPEFFDDPFFVSHADPQVMKQLEDPEYQKSIAGNAATQRYKKALEVASANLKTLTDAEVPIAFGTDSGPPARFQGYFEHLEMELMAKAGLSPMEILVSATGQAARCLQLDGQLGSLEPGKWADLVILNEDPLEDIRNARAIHSVWIAGNRVP